MDVGPCTRCIRIAALMYVYIYIYIYVYIYMYIYIYICIYIHWIAGRVPMRCGRYACIMHTCMYI